MLDTDFFSRTSEFVRQYRLKGKPKDVLLWLKRGDTLKEYDGQRIFLHSSDLPSRPSIQLSKLTLLSLVGRGLVHPVKESDGFSYELTEDGDFVAKLLLDLNLS